MLQWRDNLVICQLLHQVSASRQPVDLNFIQFFRRIRCVRISWLYELREWHWHRACGDQWAWIGVSSLSKGTHHDGILALLVHRLLLHAAHAWHGIAGKCCHHFLNLTQYKFVGMESFLTAVTDIAPFFQQHRAKFSFVVTSCCFLVGSAFCMEGGFHTFKVRSLVNGQR